MWVTIADHYEPRWRRADLTTAQSRVALWRSAWPEIAKRCKPDSVGNAPRYTFFFPEEEYHPTLMEPLAEMVREGIADVEVHLHHDGEGRQNFVDRISSFCGVLDSEHGLLRKRDGKLTFGFIHGNWALDNSRPDGRLCGLNDEIRVLRDLGCYADFTMPSGDSPTQASFGEHDLLLQRRSASVEVVRRRGSRYAWRRGRRRSAHHSWSSRNALERSSASRLETGELRHGNVATPYRVKALGGYSATHWSRQLHQAIHAWSTRTEFLCFVGRRSWKRHSTC